MESEIRIPRNTPFTAEMKTWEISKIEQIVCYSHTYFHTLGVQQTGKTEKGCFS